MKFVSHKLGFTGAKEAYQVSWSYFVIQGYGGYLFELFKKLERVVPPF